jgi:hypothetical protein
MPHEIIPQHLSITAMRSSGYRDTAHAIAELIDNSIQAGEQIPAEMTEVEVICVDKPQFVSQRTRNRIDSIAVYDNAVGMDAETLRIALQFGNGTHLDHADQDGIGKFGMGLPNASISQARRVDVFTWRNGCVLHSYLDVSEIEKRTLRLVPEPEVSVLPEDWLKLFRTPPGLHGTLVIWSGLDRVNWKQSAALLRNAEFLIGRIYRYFIHDGKVRIRLAAYEVNGSSLRNVFDDDVRPNDPLYLMAGTSAPAPYDAEAAFDPYGEPVPLEVKYGDQTSTVWIKYSLCKPSVRELGGNTKIGQHVAKNQGVSVVRARRELELNHSFEVGYNPRERWWGIEVLFDPDLDAVFGVTNNKQAATNFYMMDKDADAAAEDMSVADYNELLLNNEDPRLVMYAVSTEIGKTLNTLRQQIERMKEGSRRSGQGGPGKESAEAIASRATKQRRMESGKQGRSDRDEALSQEERVAGIQEELEAEGVSSGKAREIAVSYVTPGVKFMFHTAEIPGATVFDVRHKVGEIIITINRRHPAQEHLFELLKNGSNEQPDTPALIGLKLLLTAWARMEDEAVGPRLQILEDIRQEWGRIARDFMNAAG